MPNCSNAYSISTYKPVPDDWTYESNAQIARAAEAAGFDFLFPVAKWKGYGGKTDFLGTSLETMTWAGALLATTERIQVFSTVHVPIFHPLVAAKMGATLDHIGKGRWGLNVVSGWSEREFGMMGIEVLPHTERYERTAAYIEIIKGLWTCEPGTFNHESKWYRIRDGWVMPQPTRKPHPPIANAGVSEEARELVARLCDWAFIAPPSLEASAGLTADFQGARRALRTQRQVLLFSVRGVARDRTRGQRGTPPHPGTDGSRGGRELGARPDSAKRLVRQIHARDVRAWRRADCRSSAPASRSPKISTGCTARAWTAC